MPDETLVKKNKIKMAGFAASAAKIAKEEPESVMATAPNRIGLMLDDSGSMQQEDSKSGKSKIDLLKDAVQGFVQACDWSTTNLAMYPIPVQNNAIALTNQSALIILGALSLQAGGSTPLGATMREMIADESITRGVIVSDGEATDGNLCMDVARDYAKAEIPIDCVHIGDAIQGEETLKEIAKITGGVYLKFKDVGSFAGAMKYLSPKYRALLADPQAAKLIGADEIRS